MKPEKIILLICKVIAAVIMLQTLYFKFTAAPESVYIFTILGLEPWGRIGIGIAELITSVLLFIPGLTWLGALSGCGLMAGAIFSHLTQLGIVVQEDGGQLFIYALLVLASCTIILWMHRKQIPIIQQFFK
jgi:uncharacterized membrane protein YphA (DoxX/SURF4 family)